MGLWDSIKTLIGFASETPVPQRRPVRASPGVAEQIIRPASARVARQWAGKGSFLEIDSRLLADPMVYWIDSSHDQQPYSPSTILRRAPVNGSANTDPGYWPSYFRFSPAQRGGYLDWLAGGRRDPQINIGYVFVYFYGLEWRALLEGADHRDILRELVDLHRVYGQNRSFHTYCCHLIGYITLLSRVRVDWLNLLDHLKRQPHTKIPKPLVEAVIAMQAGKTLPIPWVIEALKHVDGCTISSVQKQTPKEFTELLSKRLTASHPNGLPIPEHGMPSVFDYGWAMGTIPRPVDPLPYNAFLGTDTFLKLAEVWHDCTAALRPFVRKAASATNDGGEAYAALPQELRATRQHPHHDQWMDWFHTKSGDHSVALVPVRELVERTQIGSPSASRLSASDARHLADMLAAIGLAIEPDPRSGVKLPALHEQCALFRPVSGHVSETSASANPMRLVIELCMAVAAADGQVSDDEWEQMLHQIDRAGALSVDDHERLKAYGVYLQHASPGLGHATKAHLAKLDASHRNALAALVVTIALADGVVTDAERAALNKIYKALDLPESQLDDVIGDASALPATTAAASMTGGSHGTVVTLAATVAQPPTATPPSAGPVAPLKPAAVTERRGIAINWDAVARLQAETAQVQAMLAQALTTTDADEHGGAEPPPAPPRQGPVETTSVPPTAPPAPEIQVAGSITFEGLDPRANAIVAALKARDEITVADFASLCKTAGLMPSAAIDVINEWSDDRLGDFILTGDGPYTINRHLLA